MTLHHHQTLTGHSISLNCMTYAPASSGFGSVNAATLASKIGARRVYVVLDFDGVLHSVSTGPWTREMITGKLDEVSLKKRLAGWKFDSVWPETPPGSLFNKARLLSNLLRALPTARIVVSTSWRNALDLSEIKRLLPTGIASRVVDALPKCLDQDDGTRERLASAWLANREKDALWIAFDDQPRHYSDDCDHLIVTTEAGLMRKDIDAAFGVLSRHA